MLSQRHAQAPRRDRQGHAAVGLHAGAGADRRVYHDGHGRRAGRPAADPGDRDADAQPARRYRRRASRPRTTRSPTTASSCSAATATSCPTSSKPRSKRRIEHGPTRRAAPGELGRAKRLEDAGGRYIEFVKQSFPKGLRLDGLRVVVDCAHGAAYKVAPTVFWELGAEVFTHRRVARRAQHQPRMRRARARADAPRGAGAARRYRHRARRRRRPADRRRRARRDPRRRPADGADRDQPGAQRPACGRRPGRDDHVQSRARALPRRAGHRAAPHRGRRPLRRREDARLGCNLGGEQSGPHHPQRLCDDRRRADRRAAGAGRDRRDRQAGQRGVPRLRAGAAAVAQRAVRQRPAARIAPGASRRSPTPRRGSAPRAGW